MNRTWLPDTRRASTIGSTSSKSLLYRGGNSNSFITVIFSLNLSIINTKSNKNRFNNPTPNNRCENNAINQNFNISKFQTKIDDSEDKCTSNCNNSFSPCFNRLRSIISINCANYKISNNVNADYKSKIKTFGSSSCLLYTSPSPRDA